MQIGLRIAIHDALSNCEQFTRSQAGEVLLWAHRHPVFVLGIGGLIGYAIP